MQMICYINYPALETGSYGHFFNQRPLSFTQQLRIIRLEDTHGHSKLASDRINYLLDQSDLDHAQGHLVHSFSHQATLLFNQRLSLTLKICKYARDV